MRATQQWKIENFDSLPDRKNRLTLSPKFDLNGRWWRFMLWPGGKTDDHDHHAEEQNPITLEDADDDNEEKHAPTGQISLGFKLCDYTDGVEDDDPEAVIAIKYTLKILNQTGRRPDITVTDSDPHMTAGDEIFFTTFAESARVQDEEKGFSVNSTVMVELDVRTIFEPVHGESSLTTHSCQRVPAPTIISDLTDLLRDERFHDAVITVVSSNGGGSGNQSAASSKRSGSRTRAATAAIKEEEFHVHKAILSARSPYFRAMFNEHSSFQESSTHKVRITDIEPAAFRVLLHFLYTDECTTQNISELGTHLLAASDKYGLDRLHKMCQAHMCKQLTVDSVCNQLLVATQHHAELLKTECLGFIARRADEVMDTEGYKNELRCHPDLVMEIMAYKLGNKKRKRSAGGGSS